VDVEEGRLADDFSGRTWGVTVAPFGEVQVQKADARDEKKKADRERRDHDNTMSLLAAVDKLSAKGRPVSYRQARILAGLNTEAMERAVYELVGSGVLAECEVQNGKKKQKVRGLKRPQVAEQAERKPSRSVRSASAK
jgi:hypothetical protein